MPNFLDQSVVSVGGVAEVIIEHNNAAAVWVIEQISGILSPNSTNGNISIFHNDIFVTGGNLVANPALNGGTALGLTAGQKPELYLTSSDHIKVIINQGTHGDQFTVRAQYREFSQNDPQVYGVIGMY